MCDKFTIYFISTTFLREETSARGTEKEKEKEKK